MNAWVNIDTPLKTYTVHIDHDTCQYVADMKQKSKQGWKKQLGTGGWKLFRSREGTLNSYDINHKDKLVIIERGSLQIDIRIKLKFTVIKEYVAARLHLYEK
ncbi:hypothetical protein QD46_07710 [Paenibacillus polymyxa]|uniref:hypothetical protein n=1 Tax=Paenibacillus polymyxa TaxID=1406 RepID=UPI0005CE48F2|nr:hypothetical protein [Paenibacillus polymyxa]KJD40526.1 hypothetical protein QD46_07710 [Paenibacillus polymyxa]